MDIIYNSFDDLKGYDYETLSFKDINKKFVITGAVGCWNGTFQIQPVLVDTFKEAFDKCLGNNDDIKVYVENKRTFIKTYDHDGVSTFEIKALSDKGNDLYLTSDKYYDFDLLMQDKGLEVLENIEIERDY